MEKYSSLCVQIYFSYLKKYVDRPTATDQVRLISHIERNSSANGCHDRVSAKDDTHYLITYIHIYYICYEKDR